MNVTDEMLMAYADGDLDEATRAQVEQAMEAQPELREVVERHTRLRASVSQTFEPVLEEKVPDRLSRMLESTPAPNVVPFKRADTVRSPQRWQLPVWMSIAASAVLGVAIGYFVWHRPEASATVVAQSDGLVASGTLASALAQQLASTQTGKEPVRLGVSYRDRAGEYCRTFSAGGENAFAGIACANGGNWRIRMLTEAQSREGGEYATAASSIPTSVLEVVNENIQGEPLNAAQEARAAEQHWKR
jgi:hypothetical protein